MLHLINKHTYESFKPIHTAPPLSTCLEPSPPRQHRSNPAPSEHEVDEPFHGPGQATRRR
jgi:hypothetical protein